MQAPLPSITYQRRKQFRPSIDEVEYTYDILNKHIFYNALARPPISMGHYKGFWGECTGHDEFTNYGTFCEIRICKNWFCQQWMVTTLAHEMAHQYEWDVVGDWYEERGLERKMTHRTSFFIFRSKMAEFGIDLKSWHGQKRWFKHQDFTKC